MKKFFSLVVIIALILSAPGCSKKVVKDKGNLVGTQEIAMAEALTIEDYFPFRENLVMDYEGLGYEYAEQTTFVEFVDGNRAQMKIMNPGTVFVKVIENKNGELTEVFSEGEFYHIENMLMVNSNSSNILLKEPLEIGNSWSNSQGNKVEITGVDKEINTPSGTYKALEVTTKYENGNKLREYYARDIGLVAKIYSDDTMTVETLLKEIETTKQKMELESFYPIKDDIGTAYVVQEVEFGTNDNIGDILEKVMKNPPIDNLLPAISEGTKINNIYLNRDTWALEVDFSKELFEEMNAGSSLEVEILKSIVNTMGKFYDVEKVYITLEEIPYMSGHISINPGEYFTVDTTDIEEFK